MDSWLEMFGVCFIYDTVLLKLTMTIDVYRRGGVDTNCCQVCRDCETHVPFLAACQMYLYEPSLGNSSHLNVRLAAIGEFNAYGNDRRILRVR
jgi:hypothetical protein